MDNALCDELLTLGICVSFDLSSVMCFVVTNLSGFVVMFRKTFVLKLYNELSHLRTTRDWNLTCCESILMLQGTSSVVLWSDVVPQVGCLGLPNPFYWRKWDWPSCRCTPSSASACKTCAVHHRGVGSQPLSAASVPFCHVVQVNQALPLPMPVFSCSEFCAGSLRRTDGCVWSLLLLGRMWEKGCEERRMCAALWGSWWEGATVAPWLWTIGSAKIIKNPWTVLCNCWDGVLLAFFQLLSEE